MQRKQNENEIKDEADITLLDTNALLYRENCQDVVHKDMSDAYPKIEALEIRRGRKLELIGNFAVLYQVNGVVPTNGNFDSRNDDNGSKPRLVLEEAEQYAIKILQEKDILVNESSYESNENRKVCLETEIRILSNMQHPNIINLKATSSLEPYSFIVLERLFDTLATRIDQWGELERKVGVMFRKKKLNKLYEKKMLIAYDVLTAISHLHKQ